MTPEVTFTRIVDMRLSRTVLQRFIFLVALTVCWPGAPQAWAAESAATFPSRSIEIVVPFAPGGAADILARVAAQFTSTETGWSFHVENITGAGGLVGAQAAARATADGYTLLLCNIACVANQFMMPEANWDPTSALTPVVVIGNIPNVLVVGPSVQAATLKEFVAHARSSAQKISIATSGPGSSSSMTAELFGSKADIPIMEVPYRGSSAATPDLISGRVDAMVMGLPESIALVRGGKVRALGVTSHDRAPSLPDVPTIAEAGVPDYQFLGWLSLFAPKNTPADIIAKLNAGFNKALASPALLARFSEQSIQAVGGPPDVAGRLLNDDVALWGPILRKTGNTAQ
jgi:tripartite-type tricarboxylate transporter receptor subunit TctC